MALIPERRRDFEERRPNEYLILPAVASLPGIGVFVGVISSFSNVGDTGIDAGGTIAESVDGSDIGVRILAVREIPLLFPGLLLQYIYGDIRLGDFQSYLPGRNSPNFTIPITARLRFQSLRPSLQLFERRFNLIYSVSYVDRFGFDDDGNEFAFAGHDAEGEIFLDFTDDVVDPTVGLRLRYTTTFDAPKRTFLGKNRGPANLLGEDDDLTIRSYQLTGYIPLSKKVVLVSDNRYFWATGSDGEDRVVAGGELPLRGYPAMRWRDRYGVFHAAEFRYTEPLKRDLDWFLVRGTFEGLQYAVFYEIGQVSPKNGSDLYKDMHASYGAGVRGLFEAIVVRLDLAASNEGLQTHLTINQPF